MTLDFVAQAIVSGLLMGCLYGLIAAGLSLIFGLMEIVNFAHGEFLMLSMYGFFWLWALAGVDPIFSIPMVGLAMGLLGVLTYQLLIRRLLRAPVLAQICGTFGLSVALKALAQFFWTPDFRTIEDPLAAGRLAWNGIFIGTPQVVAGALSLAAFGALWLFITRTQTGLGMTATAQDRRAAAVLGIPVHRMYAIGWAVGLLCVTVAGAGLSNYFYIFPNVGDSFVLLAFAAVAVGGFGSIWGSLLAGLAIGLVESLAGVLLDPSYKTLFVFLLFFGVLAIRPNGFLGNR